MCSHVTSPESRIEIIFKTTNICMNSLMTIAALWTLCLETMAAAILDAASQTEASSMPCRTFRFIRIMHDRMLPLLYGSSLIRKSLAVALAYTVTRNLANRKRLVHGCLVTGSSLYTSDYN
ncbi:hypothetical protein TNCV_4707891 [Trichonephila clavipes]|nr:hypothetical protein TNCV_4707891 [Trichonephila clavipes]